MLKTETIEKLQSSPISSFGDMNEICIQFMKGLGVKENTGFSMFINMEDGYPHRMAARFILLARL